MANEGNEKDRLLGLKETPDTLSTDALINSFDRFHLNNNGEPQPENHQHQENPFLDTTTSYIDANLENLRGFRRRLNDAAARPTTVNSNTNDISESTVEFKNNHPITPLKRPVSGSSLEGITSPGGDALQHIRQDYFEDPPLDLSLFQSLLDRLPDIERYNHFKGIMNNYLQILDEHEMSFATDKFIITTYNQLKNPQNSQTKLEKIVGIFINEPSNFAMKLSNHLYFQSLALRQKFFRIWLIKRRINHELNQSWEIWMIYLKKKYMAQWTYKHKVITNDLNSNAILFKNFKKMMKAWDVWKTNLQQQDSFIKIADFQQESKFFNDWKKRVVSDYDKADTFYQGNLLRESLKRWKLATISTNTNIKVKSFFVKWRRKQSRTASLQNDSLQLETVFHAGFFFSKWKTKSQRTLLKTSKLRDVYDQSLTKKYFNQWSESMYYKFIENQVLQKRDFILLQFTVYQWRERLQHRQMLEQFCHQQAQTLQSNALSVWKRQLMLKQKSSNSGKITVLKTYLKMWKLSTNRRIHLHNRDYNCVLKTFSDWKRRTRLYQLSKDYDSKILSKYWDNLLMKKIRNDNALEAGTEAYESYSRVIYFNHWRTQLEQAHKRKEKANIFVLRRFLNKLQKKNKELNSLEGKALEFYSNQVSKATSKRYFTKWHNKYENSLEKKLEAKLLEFDSKCAIMRMSIVIKSWKNQSDSYIYQEQIFKEEFLRGLYLKPTLSKWIVKYNNIREMEDKANDVNNLNLLSTGFTKLQLAFLKTEELGTKLLEFEDDHDAGLILKYLNGWSLKLLKVKRDNENISSFQRRWNRAHCRAILLLWKGKILDRQILEMDQMEEDDDESPTKFKSTFNSILPAETPRKSINQSANYLLNSGIFDKSPLGFESSVRKTSSIPGSERIKRKRIEALKSHYSQIKYAIPSPLKSETKRNAKVSSSKKLDFNQRTLSEEPNLNLTSHPIYDTAGDSFITDKSDHSDEGEQISSPIISHKKINQIFNRSSNVYRSDADNNFRRDLNHLG